MSFKDAFKAFPKGTRVIFTEDADRYPNFIVPTGTTGTVVDSTKHGVYVHVDQFVEGLSDSIDWNGDFQWLLEDWEAQSRDSGFSGEVKAPFNRLARPMLDGEHGEWWKDLSSIAALIRWLGKNDRFDSEHGGIVDAIAYVVSKPWKYEAEYHEMHCEQQEGAKV